MLFGKETSRRHVQPIVSKGEKPAGYWFKQRGYNDSYNERQASTTTGEMLHQVTDSTATPNIPDYVQPRMPPVGHGRFPFVTNRISEHDNRNQIQNYGEYFGQGYGKRLMPSTPMFNHDWIYLNEPRPVHPDRSLTQTDYRGLPPLENPHSTSTGAKPLKNPNDHWMRSSYDDYGRNAGSMSKPLVYYEDAKRVSVHPWHY